MKYFLLIYYFTPTEAGIVKRKYLAYKILIAMFLICHLILHIWYKFSEEHQDERYFVYLTRLGFILFVFSICLDAILVLARFISERKSNPTPPQIFNKQYFETRHFTLKLSMFLTFCSYSVALMITVVYFAALYKEKDNFMKNYLNFVVHLFQVSYLYF